MMSVTFGFLDGNLAAPKEGEDPAIILFEGSTPEEFGVGIRTGVRASYLAPGLSAF
jgi:hypothetical protein